MKPRLLLFGVILTSAAIGCSSPTANNIVCTDIFIVGLTVTVQDSVTGAPAYAGATVIARDGTYADSASRPANSTDTFPLPLAGERAGTYDVTVRESGYLDWTRKGVQVTRNECHVNTVAVTAKLQRPGYVAQAF